MITILRWKSKRGQQARNERGAAASPGGRDASMMVRVSTPTVDTPGDGVIAVIRRGGRYLMIQRAAGTLAAGSWCFVGGGVKPGETLEQALVREVQEEVGLEIQPLRKIWECLSANRCWRLHCWSTELVSSDIRPDQAEVADYRWLTRDEIEAWPDVLPSVRLFFEEVGERDA
jgi:8-oxo-dGTP pyrophosphatase MutT (NUDIX family)